MMGEPPPIFIRKQDLLYEMQQALLVYDHLTDRIDTMNGRYMGKDFSSIETFFNIFNIVELKQELVGFMKVIEYNIVKFHNDKSAQRAEAAKNGRRDTGSTKSPG